MEWESLQMFIGFIAQQPKPVREQILELLKCKDLTVEEKIELISVQLREKRSSVDDVSVLTD